MEDLTLVLLSILLLCSCIYLLLNSASSWKAAKQLTSPRRVMLVIAHPDDEVMFFGPTVLGLSQSCDIFLLCMSIGDYRGQGINRKDELYASCSVLGIPEQNLILVNHTSLKDDPNTRWREELVSDIVSRHAASLSIDTIITFDRDGVSSHRNHVALYYAMACLAMEDSVRRVYCLSSVNLMRKYSWLVDVPMSYLLCSTVYLASPSQWFQIRAAMFEHRSQLTWYRRLYILFSRYLLINTLEPISRPTNLADRKHS